MNPELRRNLWLELAPKRVLAMVLIVGLIIVMATPWRHPDGSWVLYMLALALGVGYGPHLAAQSVVSEVAQRTWDAQRASALSAWQMTIGKILGATSFAWCALAMCSIGSMLGSGGQRALDWLQLALVALGLQAVAYLVAMAAIRRRLPFGRMDTLAIPALALAIAGSFLFGTPHAELRWWGVELTGPVVAALLATFVGWAFIGAWQVTAGVLQIPTAIWAWPAFLLWLMIWAAGHGDFGSRLADPLTWLVPDSWRTNVASQSVRMSLAFTVLAPATYLAVAIDPRSIVAWRRWYARACAADWRAVLRETPAWVQSLLTLLLMALVLIVTTEASLTRAARAGQMDVRFMPLLVTAFVARDVAIFHLTAFGRLPGQGLAATGIYLCFLYGLAPTILAALLPGTLGYSLFLPIASDGSIPVIGFASIVLQAIAFGAWAITAVRRKSAAR